MKVRTACLESVGRITIKDRELQIEETDILVKTGQASICLADVNIYLRGYHLFPVYPGHEAGGVVVEVGSRVHEFKPGDEVILMHDVRLGGIGPGGMATYFKAKPTDLVPVPKGMDLDLAYLGESIAPFVFMVHRSGIKLGDTVVVTGMNFIGQVVAQGAKKSGAYEVVGIDNNDFRLTLAKQLGIDFTINSEREDAYEAVMKLTDGKGADVVFQTAAYVDTTVQMYMNLATEIVRPMGILAFQGDFLDPITINMHRWHRESINVRSIAFRHYTWREIHSWYEDTLKPVIYGMINIRPLITAIYKLEDIDKAFKEASGNPNSLKVVIQP